MFFETLIRLKDWLCRKTKCVVICVVSNFSQKLKDYEKDKYCDHKLLNDAKYSFFHLNFVRKSC